MSLLQWSGRTGISLRALTDQSPPVLVNRGWISKVFGLRETRPASVDPNTTIIKGLSVSMRDCVHDSTSAAKSEYVYT